MELQLPHEVFNYFEELIQLSDAAFYNLLGLLFVVVFFRISLPLHKNMAKELGQRNEIVDLAEKDGCTEFDIFVMAVEYYEGREDTKKAERDFSNYLCNWPENYILPYYLRLYLKMREHCITNSCGL
jgi:hypothetical protein